MSESSEQVAGFVRLARSFFAHPLWLRPREYSHAEAWMDLIQMAAYRDRRQMIGSSLVAIHRGSVVTAERFLSNRWQWSRTKVRAFLQLLTVEGMVKLKKDRDNTEIILCNYGTYNGSENEKEPRKDRAKTAKEPQKDQIRRSEEGEESKESISEPIASPLGTADGQAATADYRPRKAKKPVPTDEEYIADHKSDPDLHCIDIGAEVGKMRRWCAAKGVRPTRLRFVNWLNRAASSDRAMILPLSSSQQDLRLIDGGKPAPTGNARTMRWGTQIKRRDLFAVAEAQIPGPQSAAHTA